ncbi:hypothetical protein DPEC_G00220220 [Dallia pectoralis]|uniref:Uncharacterized protein n=1 Tax=Dallia pectoralis TaxID=75939 RepID=A0ACC2G3L5_DALPE|nr:hypothetical protein DPEC_G00220220 [Dallia pectoralis]
MGRSQVGYAVIELVNRGSLHPLKSDFRDLRSVKVTEGIMSAQRTEIMALTEACRALTGLKGSIFTDSAYAFGVAHYYGKIWAKNGYRKSNGKPITHEKEIRALIEACELPESLNIVKCAAHQKVTDVIGVGNNLVDQYAKAAACGEPIVDNGVMAVTRSGKNREAQGRASRQEVLHWKTKGGVYVDGVWTGRQGQVIIPEILEKMVLIHAHGGGHSGRAEMLDVITRKLDDLVYIKMYRSRWDEQRR